jgi:hypothetical protein
MENITEYNFILDGYSGKCPFKISFLGGREMSVQFQWPLSNGKVHKELIKVSDFSYRIKQESTKLKLINDKGMYWDGFPIEDKEKLELFLENTKLIMREKISSINEFKKFLKKQELSVKKKVNLLITKEFDKDDNGELDILEGDNLLMDLLEKNQSQITEFDHTLVRNIIRLNNFLNTKKKNLINIFNLLKTVKNEKDLEGVLLVLRQGIDNYQSLLIHSLNMVISLKERQMITYYELYETFDSLGVFNSNWENEVSGKLSNIDSKLSNLIDTLKEVIVSIQKMEDSITKNLDELTYTTKTSFEQLNTSLTTELKSIRNGVQWNNLLTGIQTYQLYKINKYTQSLKG